MSVITAYPLPKPPPEYLTGFSAHLSDAFWRHYEQTFEARHDQREARNLRRRIRRDRTLTYEERHDLLIEAEWTGYGCCLPSEPCIVV